MDLKLTIDQGGANIGTQVQVFDHAAVHLRIKEAKGIAPRVLGTVHRQVGVFQQRPRIEPVPGKQRDAQRAADGDLQLVQAKRFGQLFDDLAGNGGGRHVVRQATQNNQKLVAALAADGIRVPHGLKQAPGHVAQQQITRAVAQRIVDGFEIVKIKEQHRRRGMVASRTGNGLLQAVKGQHAVGKVGQGIAVRQHFNARVGLQQVLFVGFQPCQGAAQVAGHQPDEIGRHRQYRQGVDQTTPPGWLNHIAVPAQYPACHDAGQAEQNDRQQTQVESARAEHACKDQDSGKRANGFVMDAL